MEARVNGTRLFYATHGRGRPLLVLHGGLGLGHAYLRPWLDQLGDRVELIYYDHRGSGRSARLRAIDEGSIDAWAADAEALRAALGHERTLLFGHSFGGFLAQEYAVRYPQRVAGLILCATAPTVDLAAVRAAATETYLRRDALRPLLRFFARRGASAGHGGRVGPEETAARLARLADHFRLHGAPTGGSEGYPAAPPRDPAVAAPVPDLPPTLQAIAAPALVIGGRRDPVVPPEGGPLPLHAALPNAELALLDGSGHFPFIDEPETFARVVGTWLNRVS
jgi:proline iminopeptidase